MRETKIHTFVKLRRLSVLLMLFVPFTLQANAEQIVKIEKLVSMPMLDGRDSEWRSISGVTIKLKSTKPDLESHVNQILLKSGVFSDMVFFYLEWEDASKDTVHKPWIWDTNKNKYIRGPQREDRLAIQFLIDGDYTTDWLSGKEFVADMWHWKSSRSNPNDMAHDKMTIISQKKIIRSAKFIGRNKESIYISRKADDGDKLYISKRYRKYVKDQLPKYLLTTNPKGSVADVKAKGVWKDGKWHLELARKMNTQHRDDVLFVSGKAVLGGIAVFNHSENDEHSISDTLLFQF